MESYSPEWHSESEFYYPSNTDENINTENIDKHEHVNEKPYNEQQFLLEVREFIEGQRPDNTKKKTFYDINVWKRFLTSAGEERNIEDIPAKDLNVLMSRFFMEIKKKDGDQYEPATLTSFHRSLQRYLNDHGSTLNILKDQHFSLSREALASRRRQLLRHFGKGNRPNAARPLTDAEEDLMFERGEFGQQDPEVLQRTVWWLLSLHFGFRARDESRKLKWGDVKLQINGETGNEELVWIAERGSKCRSGEGPGRPFCPTAQASNNTRCPVFFYKAFRSHRPTEMNKPESPFYLAIKYKRKADDPVWYANAPLGKNSLGKFLKIAAKRTGLQGNVTNHAVRKTSIGRLLDADFPSNYVAQLSGHKNLKSLDSYKSASLDHQRKMSLVLSRSEHVQHSTSTTTREEIEASTASASKTKPNALLNPPVTPKTASAKGLFSGATIGKIEGCSFTFNVVDGANKEKPPRKRHIIISDDSDSD